MHPFRLMVLVALMSAAVPARAGGIAFGDGTGEWQRRVSRLFNDSNMPNRIDSLKRYLADNGFLDCRVKAGDNTTNDSLFFGERYSIGRIILTGDLRETLRVGAAMNRKNIETSLREIIGQYQSRGFYFTSARPDSFVKSGAAIDIYFSLRTGPPVTISAIEIEGLNRTAPKLLARYIPLKKNDILLPDRIERSAARLRNLDFVTLDGSPRLVPDEGYRTVTVQYPFRERRQFFFEGGGGYVPGDKGYVLWHLDLKSFNLFGGGQGAEIMTDHREEDKSILRIDYSQPVFLIGLGRGSISLGTRDYRHDFYEFALKGSYAGNINDRLDYRAALGWKNVEPALASAGSYQVYEAGFEIRTASLDNIRNFRRHFAFDWGIAYLGRNYRSASEPPRPQSVYNDTKIEIRSEMAVQLPGRASGYVQLDFKDIESTEKPLPPAEEFFLGGPGSLRGYRHDQFRARRLLLLKLEPRFFISERDYFYPFADGAYFEDYILNRNGEPIRTDEFKTGYGLGMKLSSEQGSFRIELSWGEETKITDPRLHIILSDTF